MELEREFEETLSIPKNEEKSVIMMTLTSKLSYEDAKIVSRYSSWKKL